MRDNNPERLKRREKRNIERNKQKVKEAETNRRDRKGR